MRQRYTLDIFKKLYTSYTGKKVDNYVPAMMDLFEEIQKMVIRDTQNFTMPCAFGSIQILVLKNKAAVDFSKYEATGEFKRNMNLHTNREIYAFRWVCSKYERVAYKHIYKYTPPLDPYNRTIGRRGLAKWIKECANDPKRKDFTPFRKR